MRCADLKGMFRIIQSVTSKKAEPIKVWMASVAAERINQAIDPERSIDQAITDYRRIWVAALSRQKKPSITFSPQKSLLFPGRRNK